MLNFRDENIIKSHIIDMKSKEAFDSFTIGLIKDFENEILLAFKSENYTNWGEHYVRCYLDALALEYCPNFKDNALLNYGGSQFDSIRDHIDNKFLYVSTIKPLIPSRNRYSRTQSSTPVNVSVFNTNVIGVCIHGDGNVKLNNNTFKKIKELKKDDYVECLDKNNTIQYCKILCVVITIVNRPVDMTTINDLIVTPYHPIKINDKWEFPIDVGKSTLMFVDYVYNFIIESSNSIIVNNIPCVSLGHYIDDPKCYHPFFGSNKCIIEIMNSIHYDSGLVTLTENSIVRDKETGLVVSIIT
jgi:hypothetical protein